MLRELSVKEASEKIAIGEITSQELVGEYVKQIEKVDSIVKSFITITAESALAEAKSFDSKKKEVKKLSPLAGIPLALKDNMCTKGVKTTCSSKILANFVPPYDATVAEKIKKASGICLGKTNLDEFAMGSSTENSAFFETNNPWDLKRVPGGSSGGSAAAVAAGEVPYALGSDTGGSIREPAAYCGIVGMKPTYGMVSRYGLVAFASSLDQIGPLTKNVEDCALVLQAISGHDPLDSTSLNQNVPDYSSFLNKDVKGLKAGIPKELFDEGISDGVKKAVQSAIQVLQGLGVEVEECSLPNTHYGLNAYYLIAPAEASSNLARFDGIRYGVRIEGENLWETYLNSRSEGFGNEVKRRIMLGTYALSSGYYDAYYLKALKVRTLIKEDFDGAFEKYDILITPTAPTTAFEIGKTADPLTMYLNDVCTIPANLAGIPAISVPCGFSEGMPVGMQIMGPALGEGKILQVAHAFERETDFHNLRPVIAEKGEVTV